VNTITSVDQSSLKIESFTFLRILLRVGLDPDVPTTGNSCDSSNASTFDEDKYVKEMMYLHGIDKVRGGSYVEVTLNEETINFLRREIRGATDGCFKCGSTKHFASSCKKKDDLVSLVSSSSSKEKAPIICYICQEAGHVATTCPQKIKPGKKKRVSKKKVITCYRCNKKGHYSTACPN